MTGHEITICVFIISFPKANKQGFSHDSEQNSTSNKMCSLVISGFPAPAAGILYSSESTKKTHLFHFVKTLHFSPRLSISRCVNFIKISFSEAKCWLYGTLRGGSHSLCNVWSLLQRSTENSLENHREGSENLLGAGRCSLASWTFCANLLMVKPENQQHSSPVCTRNLSRWHHLHSEWVWKPPTHL